MSFEQNTNGLGVLQHYGARDVNRKFGAITGNKGDIVEVEYVFTYDDLPTANQDNIRHEIPQNALISDFKLEVITAFAGGTSYDIGLQQPDGSNVDLSSGTSDSAGFTDSGDGFVDALALTEIDEAGNWIDLDRFTDGTNTGADINRRVKQAAQLVVSAAGTFTAGKARIILDYVEPRS